jgi:kynureninase
MVGLQASLALFDEAGIDNLQAKSRQLTEYLHHLLSEIDNPAFNIITPSEPHRRAAQLSLYFGPEGKPIHQRMIDAGIVVDWREPGVVRVAPAPMYNSFEDVYRFCNILQQI